jgi:hypothetical protein
MVETARLEEIPVAHAKCLPEKRRERFLRNAAHAQELANMASDAHTKDTYVSLARTWLRLACHIDADA